MWWSTRSGEESRLTGTGGEATEPSAECEPLDNHWVSKKGQAGFADCPQFRPSELGPGGEPTDAEARTLAQFGRFLRTEGGSG
jgi:hypothetical protein